MLSSLEHRNEMRRIAGTKQHDATTRSIVMEARMSHQTTRRLSTDSRFIRRLRRGPAALKTASDIVFDGELSRFVLFHSQENSIVIFGDPDMVRCASSVTFISVDGTFSRCPATHYQLSPATHFVKVDFHFLLHSVSSKIRSRQHTQRSFQQSIRFHPR